MNRWFYYVRISTKRKQKTDRQIYSTELQDFCKRNGINNKDIIVMEEKETGKHFERPQYQLLKKVAANGDNILVSAIDRFGRNYIQGRKEFAELINKGVKVYVLNRPMLEDMYKLNDNISKFMINFLVDWELMNAEEELKRRLPWFARRKLFGAARAAPARAKFPPTPACSPKLPILLEPASRTRRVPTPKN